MLNQRLRDHVEPLLRQSESVVAAMAGFRPLSSSAALFAVFPAVLGGFAVSSAAGLPAWVGGGLGGGIGGGLAMWLDQRRARAEHDGKGLSVGLVVTDKRLFVLDLGTGPISARVVGVELEMPLDQIRSVDEEKMQGSGLKRSGVVIGAADGTSFAVIPARLGPFLEAVRPS